MSKVRKVGIYKDTKREDWVVMVMNTVDGTYYFPFCVSDFLAGWFRFSGNQAYGPRGGKTEKSENMKAEGAIAAIGQSYGGPLPEEVEEAIRGWGINPTFLRYYGKTGAHRIKWARKKSGGWGGPRVGAGRKGRTERA